MIIMIPATEVSATGSALKHVHCGNCGTDFVYILVRTHTIKATRGFVGDEEKYAAEFATQMVKHELATGMDCVRCPECQYLQPEMLRAANRRRTWITLSLYLFFSPIFAFVVTMYFMITHRDPRTGAAMFPAAAGWTIAVGLLLAAVALAVWLASWWTFEPNEGAGRARFKKKPNQFVATLKEYLDQETRAVELDRVGGISAWAQESHQSAGADFAEWAKSHVKKS